MRRLLPLVLVLLAACGGGAANTPADTAIVVVNAPIARAGSSARLIERGARLAVEQINARGGIDAGDRTVKLELRVLDSDLSPARSADNVREAVRLGATGVVDEGTGVDASWQIAREAGMPIGIVLHGGEDLIDPKARPNVFRIAPTNRGMAFRLAEYLVPKKLKIATLTDDSPYGNDGAASLAKAFRRTPEALAGSVRVAAGSTDLAPQVLQLRRGGATALLVWARPAVIAAAVRAARAARWNVPIYTPASGADPFVRSSLADRPEWIDGLTFASGRLTAEQGPEPFEQFRAAYEQRFGVEKVGVRSNGKDVVQPPDWAMYAYDFVNVLAAAIRRAGTAKPGAELLAAMERANVEGANGDQRGFNANSHEGVVEDDVYFARFRNMIFEPVGDDLLSSTLPKVPQTN